MDDQRNTLIQAAPRKRICLFAGYNAEGCIHEYVVFYISRLAAIADVHYLADCEMVDGQLEKLAPYVKTARGYRHEKYDFGSWQELTNHIGWNTIEDYDELILCNDSCYGPLFPLDSIFDTMESKQVDFWGMTESSELLTRHLQSYFLVFSKDVIHANVLKLFFKGVRKQQEFWNYVVKYEIFLTQMLVNMGFKFDSYLKARSEINTTSFPMTLIRDFKFPFIKIKSYTNPETNLNEPIDGLEQLLSTETSYDASLISTHLISIAPDYEARVSRRFEGAPAIPLPTKPEKILVHLHLSHPEEAPYFISRMANISCEFDLFLTVVRMDELTKEQFKAFDDKTTIIELPDAVNDVLPFLHVIHLVRLEGYDYVLKMHSTGIRFDHENLLGLSQYAYGLRNALVEPLLESESAFRRHLGELSGNRTTGMIASAVLLSIRMREWSKEKDLLVEAWAKRMNLLPKHDPAPVVAGGMFLMRASLFSPLCSLDISDIEREIKEGGLTDETVEHALEKIIALLLDQVDATVTNPGIRVHVEQAKQENVLPDELCSNFPQKLISKTGSMNIVFVCHGGLKSQSTYHVLSIAEQLNALGHDCVACIPESADDCDASMRATFIPILTFKEVRKGKIRFTNGLGPALVHCWTPREQVKNFTMYLVGRYKCPYFVHLEDNEREILNRELKNITYEQLTRLPPSEQDKHIVNSELRIHPHKHWEFLQRSSGCTILIDRLAEHVPAGIPVQLFWPGYDDCFSVELGDQKNILRAKYGIPEANCVVLYSGAFHDINKEEIYRMVLVLKILRNRGMPLTFVKTGHNQFPEILEDGIDKGWIKDLGFLPRNDLPEILSLSDVLVQPGSSDPFNDYRFPSKLPEALVSGIPIILPYSNLGRILKDKEEALVSHDHSIDSLIGQITYLFDHPAERIEIGRKGQVFCREHLGWEQASRTIQGFYQACLMDSRESLIKDGRIQMKATDNLKISSAPVSAGGIARLSAPVELHEIERIYKEEMKLDEKRFQRIHVLDAQLSDLHRKYNRKKRRLKRFRLISLVEVGIILALIFIIFHSK
jgi:lipopolysaccharide biosynthesis protein/glycosyltransferase involved in cell wall biosynthesis